MLRYSVKDYTNFCRNSVFDYRKVRREPLFYNSRFGYLMNVVLPLVILKDLVVGFHNLWAFLFEGLFLALESHESYLIIVS